MRGVTTTLFYAEVGDEARTLRTGRDVTERQIVLRSGLRQAPLQTSNVFHQFFELCGIQRLCAVG